MIHPKESKKITATYKAREFLNGIPSCKAITVSDHARISQRKILGDLLANGALAIVVPGHRLLLLAPPHLLLLCGGPHRRTQLRARAGGGGGRPGRRVQGALARGEEEGQAVGL